TPTEPHHTPSPEAQQSSPTALSSPLLPPATTKTIPTVIPTDIPTVSQGKGFPTVSGLKADQDRENIIKTSTLPHDSPPRTEMASKITTQELEITSLKAKIKLLEDKDGGGAEPSGEDTTIKGRSLETGEEAGKEKMVESDTPKKKKLQEQIDAKKAQGKGGLSKPILAGPPKGYKYPLLHVVSVPPIAEVATVSVPTGSGLVPIASPIFTTVSVVTPYSRRKGKEKMVESDTPKKKKLQEQIDFEYSSISCVFVEITYPSKGKQHRASWIKREFSVARTLQQNGVVERKNRTLIEAARTMLADSLLLIIYWAEAVNTACYVQNRISVTKPHNKTPYELLLGIGPIWLFNIDTLTQSMNNQPVVARNQPNNNAGIKENIDAGKVGKETVSAQQYILLPLWPTGSQDPRNTNDASFNVKENENDVYVSPSGSDKPKKHDDKDKRNDKGKNPFNYPDDPDMPVLEDIVYSNDEEDVGVEAEFSNLETIYIYQSYSNYQSPQRSSCYSNHCLCFLYGFHGIYQMDVKSAFLYKTIKKEVYVCQPPGFEDPNYPDKVYKVIKAFYGLHQDPRAWYETLSNYLLENGFQRGKIDLTLFMKKQKRDILLVQVYMDDIFFGSTNKELCKAFEKLMKDKFEMNVKLASTPIETAKPLLKYPDGDDVDVHIYKSMIGSLMYLTSSRPDIMLFTVIATSSTEAEDVAAASCCAQRNTLDCVLLGSGLKMQELASPKANGSWHFLTVVSCKLMLFGLTKDASVNAARKKVVITEDVIRQDTCFDDADGVECLPNEKIFTELARMGFEKPPPKLTFYKAFLSIQWKFLLHTLIQCVSAKRIAWNEFSCSMASAVICLATVNNQVDDLTSHNTKYTPPALIQKVFVNMRRVEQDKQTEALEILKLKKRVKKLKKKRKSKYSGLKRLKKRRTDDYNAATKDVNAVEPTVFDDEECKVKTVNEVSDEPTLPSPTPATPPPPPQQEHIPSPPQADTAP
nr:hypothetical protein [Tanacetum cinerariifolium]